MEIHALQAHVVYPFKTLTFNRPFLGINIDTLIASWVAMAIVAALALFLRYQLANKQGSIISYCTLSAVEGLEEFMGESLAHVPSDLIIFASSIFVFVLSSSLVSCLMLKEATLDLNTDLALALIIFTYIQVWGLRFKGFHYFEKFVEPVFLFLPFNMITQGSRILSICFRLFANVLAGALIWEIGFAAAKIIAVIFILCLAIIAACNICARSVDRLAFVKDSILYQIVKNIALLPGVWFAFWILFHGGIMQAGILMMLITNYLTIEVGEHE